MPVGRKGKSSWHSNIFSVLFIMPCLQAPEFHEIYWECLWVWSLSSDIQQRIMLIETALCILIYLIFWSWHWVTCGFSPKSKWLWNKHLEWAQDNEAVTTVQPNTFSKEDFLNIFKSSNNDWIRTLEAKGSILRGINDNISFVMIKYLNIQCTFCSNCKLYQTNYTSMYNYIKQNSVFYITNVN